MSWDIVNVATTPAAAATDIPPWETRKGITCAEAAETATSAEAWPAVSSQKAGVWSASRAVIPRGATAVGADCTPDDAVARASRPRPSGSSPYRSGDWRIRWETGRPTASTRRPEQNAVVRQP